jgi:hypothetical protein
LLDGRRSGWQILKCLRTLPGLTVDEGALLNVLAALKRTGIIALKNPHEWSEAFNIASVPRVSPIFGLPSFLIRP